MAVQLREEESELHKAKSKPKRPNKMQVNNLNIYYGTVLALRDVSMKIVERETLALIGPSGCGKSSFLRCLNRMNDVYPEAKITGAVYLDDWNVYEPRTDVIRLRSKVGMVFQKPNPFLMSVYDNIAYGIRIQRGNKVPKDELDAIIEQSLRQAYLWDEVKDKLKAGAKRLSGGQQQRLCIARALAIEPEVILMDEPTSALDPIATDRIEELIRDLEQTYSIVVVTHNMQQAARISRHTAFFMVDENRTGYLVEYGRTKRIFENPENEKTRGYISGQFG